jgi:thioredoxin reductase
VEEGLINHPCIMGVMGHDVIIIGAGPAGLTAGIFARQKNLDTLILEAGEAGGQLAILYPEKVIHNYPGHPTITGRDLGVEFMDHARSAGCVIREREQAIEILDHAEGLEVVTEKGRYVGKAVVVAIGGGLFKPKRLGIPEEERFIGKGLEYRVPEKDTLLGKRVMFVGGGNSACEMSLVASEVSQVCLVHRRDCFRADESVVDRLKCSNIRTVLNAQVKRILGEDRLEGVVLSVGDPPREEEMELDLLVVNIGLTSELEYLERWGLELEEGMIKVDTLLRTSRKGVFACGDVVTYPGKYRQIVTACGESATAANSAYRYIQRPNWD